MAGYTRQSTADIIPTATVRAAPINAEYNALRDAFAATGGHKHDGTTGEGEYVPLIADLDANNKVQVNTGSNTVDFYVEVAGVPVEQISIRDGVIRPITDNDIDLGATGSEFKDLYIDGIGYIDTLAVHENATVAGTLNVTGVITAPAGVVANITGNLTGNVTGDITGDLTGNVTSTGTSTFSDLDAVDLSATGTTVITSGDINSGTIDNSVIGAATPAAGTFTTLNANTSLTAATADINGGTIDGTTIGATSHTTGKFTTLQSTGQATLNTVDINGGNIDGTVIGAVGTAAGSFTTLTTSGQATLATADINGGTIDGATIGASSASTGAFTTVTASGGVTANLTGNVTGNVTGNLSGGTVTGNVTGDLTGNVTSAGTSTFNNVTIDGTLNMNAGTTATITNLTSPTNTNDAATKGYVDTQVSNLVDSAPGTLDTLNELAAALGDDPDFATTVTNSIATKLPLAGGTMTGAIAMSTNKITGAGDPTAAQDVATKVYTDTQRDTRVAKAGDTMSGNLAMGSNKVTGLAAPTDANDATSKTYVDGILGSATAASASAAAAATSESNAATSETNASNSASAAATSEANAAASYDNFDDRYLGAKSTAPTVDNDGDALVIGALYFNSTTNIMNVYGSSGWQSAGSAVNGTSDRNTYTATAGQTVFAATYDTGYVDVYLNGVKLIAGTDFTATNGTSITLTTGAAVNDVVDIVAYGTFVVADHYTKLQSDARYVEVAGDTMTGGLNITSGNLGIGTSSPSELISVEGVVGANADAPYIALSAGRPTDRYSAIGLNRGGTSNQVGLSFYTTNNLDTPTEKMRIDSSGNLLVGKSVTTFANNGIALKSSGETNITRNDGVPVYIRRNTSDGDIVQFWKDGTTVGSIASGSSGNEFKWYGAFASGAGLGIYSNVSVRPLSNTGAAADGTVTLGHSSQRFKDLYLSNSVQIHDSEGQQGRFSVFGNSTYLMSATDLQFRTGGLNAADEAMRIDSSGNVGIGTSSPTTTLTLDSGGTPTTLKIDSLTESSIDFDDKGGSSKRYKIGTNISSNDGQFEFKDMTANAERMRIDSSGNLLVGTTDNLPVTNNDVSGIALRADGNAQFSRSGAATARFNRGISDGEIVSFSKDGTTVGSIAVTGTNDLTLYSSTVNHKGLRLGEGYYIPTRNDGAPEDNTVDIGLTSYRYKDAHFSGTVNAANFNTTSDQTLKTNVETLSGSLDAVKSLRGVSFDWLENGGSEIGVIAQEVEAVLPNVVSTNDEGIKSVKYGNMVAVLIEAIKEQQAQIDELKAQLNS